MADTIKGSKELILIAEKLASDKGIETESIIRAMEDGIKLAARRKYGHDHVSQIITFGTMSARMVIRDVSRVLDIPYSEADTLAKMIPNELHITIKKAIEQNKELRDRYESDETVKKVLDIAMGLEGMPRQASTHACRYCYYKRTSRYLCSTICT